MEIEAAFVAKPVLVDLHVLARQAAIDAVGFLMDLHVAAAGAAFANRGRLFEEPRPLAEAEILERQRAGGTHVRIVAGVIGL